MKTIILTLALVLSSHAMAASQTMTKSTNMNTHKNTNMKAPASMSATQLDDLIRGELSAVSTYNQVLEKVKDKAEAQKLTAIKNDHMNAVATLRRYATSDVKEDAKTAGAWGEFTKAFTGSAKLLGNTAALKALTEGEEHGISEYKEALEDKNVSADLKNIIRTQLLPKQEEHLKTIKTFM